MEFNFKNLDDQTRSLMLKESDLDLTKGVLYHSKRFSENGKKLYPQLLKEAILSGNQETLAHNLKNLDCFLESEQRKTKTGFITAKVPENASETFSESEFNRFYIRALCLRAMETEQLVKVYRAKFSEHPRPESEAMIGKIIDPAKLLEDLRTNIGVDTALGLPAGPNSGLSVFLS
jgi:hypothetical protein